MNEKNILMATIIPFLLWGYFGVCWIVNIIQLISCDFEPSYKEEVIKAIGLIGPAAGITVWF